MKIDKLFKNQWQHFLKNIQMLRKTKVLSNLRDTLLPKLISGELKDSRCRESH